MHSDPSGYAPILLLVAALATATYAQISVLYNFGSKSGDPLNPQYSGIIAQGRDGNLYSTAPKGGANGYGAVFKITPKGALSVLHSFDGIHGSSPTGGLTLGMDGNFYGTTTDGGTLGYGTIFKITPGRTLTTLYNFTGGADGKAPTAPPIQGTDGNFYGTASQGNGSTTYGSVYKIKPSGAFTVLHTQRATLSTAVQALKLGFVRRLASVPRSALAGGPAFRVFCEGWGCSGVPRDLDE